MFVWIDETGSDNRNSFRMYGYTLRGLTPVCHRILSRGKRINVVAAISSSGVVATETTTQSVNGDYFFDFLRGTLLPHMQPFDGLNEHSILILDNGSIHHNYSGSKRYCRTGWNTSAVLACIQP